MTKKFENFNDFEVTRTRVEDMPMPTDGKTLDRNTHGGKGDWVRPFNRERFLKNLAKVDFTKHESRMEVVSQRPGKTTYKFKST